MLLAGRCWLRRLLLGAAAAAGTNQALGLVAGVARVALSLCQFC